MQRTLSLWQILVGILIASAVIVAGFFIIDGHTLKSVNNQPDLSPQTQQVRPLIGTVIKHIDINYLHKSQPSYIELSMKKIGATTIEDLTFADMPFMTTDRLHQKIIDMLHQNYIPVSESADDIHKGNSDLIVRLQTGVMNGRVVCFIVLELKRSIPMSGKSGDIWVVTTYTRSDVFFAKKSGASEAIETCVKAQI